ncbi:hypothetical protein CDLVIII_0937 [Clostridium sp. DL-VIII]|nr:hypothetical protein [Clostridium sp. DL-VIII]EHI97645.1 hypothetical protein CDLVIII_0937 [Clostridium sp. DL-VIII]
MMVGKTKLIPKNYYKDVNEEGTIVRVDYDNKSYAGTKERISNPAYVYLA